MKKGDKELPGLTDDDKPRMRGPKRASKVGGGPGGRAAEGGVLRPLQQHVCRLRPWVPCCRTLSAAPCLAPHPPPPGMPRAASPQIRKLFVLGKHDNVAGYVNTYRRTFEDKKGKKHSKAPKIQRLITPQVRAVTK